MNEKAQRKNAHVFEREVNNWYVDPPSCAHALFDVETDLRQVWDPCCGMGNIVRVAAKRGLDVVANDLIARPEFSIPGWFGALNFLDAVQAAPATSIVFNPPYGAGKPRLEEQFIMRALAAPGVSLVAALLPFRWLVARRAFLAETRSLVRIWMLSPRPSMLTGGELLAGSIPGGGQPDYAWFVFVPGSNSYPSIGWAVRDKSLDNASNWYWRQGDKNR